MDCVRDISIAADVRGAAGVLTLLQGTPRLHLCSPQRALFLTTPRFMCHAPWFARTEHRKDAGEQLETLAQPVLLRAGVSSLRLEQQLSLRAQRELWSALARLAGDARDAHTLSLVARRLAQRFLLLAERRAPHDADLVSCSLARAVVRTTASLAVISAVDDEQNEQHLDNDGGGSEDDDASLAAVHRDTAFRDAMAQLAVARFAVPALEQLTPLVRTAGDSGGDGGESGGRDALLTAPRKVLLRFTRTSQQPADSRRAPSMGERSTAQQDGDAGDDELKRRNKRARVVDHEGLSRLLQDGGSSSGGGRDERSLPPPATKLAPEVEEKASKLGRQLSSAEAQTSSRALLDDAAKGSVQLIQDTITATSATQAEAETLLRRLCELLQLAACSDEALFQITSALVESNWSSRYASVFLETSVCPKIMAASSVISRVLLQTALLFSQRYTSALIDALLVPLLTARTIGPAQGEAITRILRSGVPLEYLDGFLGKSFQLASAKHACNSNASDKTVDANSATYHFFTSDAALMVLQNVLTMKAPLADATIDSFVACCEAAQEDKGGAEELHKSLKFATLVFTMVSKYANQCAAHAEALEGIGKRLTSLMAKSTVRAILKLKSSNAASSR